MPRIVLAVEGMMIDKINLVVVFMALVVLGRQTPALQILNYKARYDTKGKCRCHEIRNKGELRARKYSYRKGCLNRELSAE